MSTTNMTKVTFKGNPIQLGGQAVSVGQPAPDVSLVSNTLTPVSLSSFKGKTCVLLSVPSLDTPICDIEAKRFNNEAASLGKNINVIVISRDLPFAQKRWCGANSASHIQSLSDHKEGHFGKSYGVVWQETGLLARAIFIVDAKGTLRYIQIVSDIASEPDYESVLNALKEIVS